MPSALKQELLDKIAATEDENLLLLLNKDYDYFSKHSETLNISDTLSAEQVSELTELINRPFGYETEPYADFKMETARWRTK